MHSFTKSKTASIGEAEPSPVETTQMQMEGGGIPPQLAPESVPIFREGIGLVLSKWKALQTPVENEWGGHDSRHKSDQLASDIFSYVTLSKEPLYIDDLENMLDEAILSLNTMAEDGSLKEVAEKLMIMHGECLEGNYQSIERLRETNHQAVAHPHVRKDAPGFWISREDYLEEGVALSKQVWPGMTF